MSLKIAKRSGVDGLAVLKFLNSATARAITKSSNSLLVTFAGEQPILRIEVGETAAAPPPSSISDPSVKMILAPCDHSSLSC